MDVLAKYGVETIDPQGEPFDPETAQAMSMVEQPDVEPNSVVAVMQRGLPAERASAAPGHGDGVQSPQWRMN